MSGGRGVVFNRTWRYSPDLDKSGSSKPAMTTPLSAFIRTFWTESRCSRETKSEERSAHHLVPVAARELRGRDDHDGLQPRQRLGNERERLVVKDELVFEEKVPR